MIFSLIVLCLVGPQTQWRFSPNTFLSGLEPDALLAGPYVVQLGIGERVSSALANSICNICQYPPSLLHISVSLTEPRHEKTCLRGLRPGKT